MQTNWEVTLKYLDGKTEVHPFHNEVAMSLFLEDLDLDLFSSICVIRK